MTPPVRNTTKKTKEHDRGCSPTGLLRVYLYWKAGLILSFKVQNTLQTLIKLSLTADKHLLPKWAVHVARSIHGLRKDVGRSFSFVRWKNRGICVFCCSIASMTRLRNLDGSD